MISQSSQGIETAMDPRDPHRIIRMATRIEQMELERGLVDETPNRPLATALSLLVGVSSAMWTTTQFTINGPALWITTALVAVVGTTATFALVCELSTTRRRAININRVRNHHVAVKALQAANAEINGRSTE